MKKLAVIDCGTNTFHLLIAEALPGGGFTEIFKLRKFVFLAEEGIETIGQAAFQRASDALHEFGQIIQQQEVEQVKAFGTAALRTASNGPALVEDAKATCGIQIDTIPGLEEARLIWRGVQHAYPLDEQVSMIMDIGGGSVEFIMTTRDGILWSQSFPVGVAVLYRKFHHSDPMSSEEVATQKAWLNDILAPLLDAIKKHQPQRIIGASGTFDVLETFLSVRKVGPAANEIPISEFKPLYDSFMQTTLPEREAMDKLPEGRARLIITALVLVDYILEVCPVQQLVVSEYAMKQGILAEML